jgi:plasmid stabilization system protein ParE
MAGGRVILRRWVPGDLLEILDYLADRSPDVAERFRLAVRGTFEWLARHPGVGSPKQFRGKGITGIRTWYVAGFRDYLVLYRPIDGGIEVLGVLHGSRNIGSHLRKRRGS